MTCIKWVGLMAVVVFTIFFSNCAVNHLADYNLKGETIDAKVIGNPRPEIFGDRNLWIDTNNPIATVARIGAAIYKEAEMADAYDRLAAAMEEVDVPRMIQEQMIDRSIDDLRFEPALHRDNADFLFHIRIKKHGIEAQSWHASVHFMIALEVKLVQQESMKLVWERKQTLRYPVYSQLFHTGDIAGNIISASVLSSLSEEELSAGFRQLALDAANHVSDRLIDDYIKSRSD